MRSVSCGVIPATGSSTSRSSGSCISSMPISSHCFWPCDSAFACMSRSEVRPVVSSTLSIRSRCAGVRRATSAFQNDLSPFQGELEVVEDREEFEDARLLELAADAGLRDFRLCQREQIDGAPEPGGAAVGPGLAGDHVHHRRLARAIWSDDAQQLAGIDVKRQRVESLEPIEGHRELFEIERLARASFALRRRQQPREAAGQKERDEHEHAAERVEPHFRERAGEVGLRVVHHHGSSCRADERAASADSDPDDSLDGVDRRELARVDDAHLRHVESAGHARHRRRDDEHPELVGLDAIAEKARAILRVANRVNHPAGARIGDRAAYPVARGQRDARLRQTAPRASCRAADRSRRCP